VCTFGIETSRQYADQITGSFYLGHSCAWGFASPDYPEAGYRRMRQFLSDSEQDALGMMQGWLGELGPNACAQFADAVVRSYPRYLAQPGLFESIRASRLLLRNRHLLERVQQVAQSSNATTLPVPAGVKFTAVVPPHWYAAAATVAALDEPDMNNKHGIRHLGEHAWCTTQLDETPDP
jgi:hypothetical protein